MTAQTTMLNVRIDDRLKAEATEKLASLGLTVADAVRMLLTSVVREGELPAGLVADPDAYDAWFRAKVLEGLADTRPTVPHQQAMDRVQALIDSKRNGRAEP
jgi:DNA-damage-inducible protein J